MSYDFDRVIPRKGTRSVKYDLCHDLFGTTDVLPMWVADMDFPVPDCILRPLEERLRHPILGYTFRDENFASALKGWMHRRHGWQIREDWIEFSPGVVPALNMLTMAFTHAGDRIIVQPPVYYPFFNAVEDHGRQRLDNTLLYEEEYRMDLEGLKKKITPDTRMIFLSNPHNPVGRCWRPEELRALANICLENNILIVSDEIHADLALPAYTHTPMASLGEDIAQQTITCLAASKTFNLAGLATSALVIGNEKIRETYRQQLDKLHIGGGNLFGAIAFEAAFTHGDAWLDQLLDYVQENIHFTETFLQEKIPGISMIRPEATYMIWLDCRKISTNGMKLEEFFVRKAGLGLNNGAMFGPGGEGFMRINIACPRSTLEKALNQLHRAVKGK